MAIGIDATLANIASAVAQQRKAASARVGKTRKGMRTITLRDESGAITEKITISARDLADVQFKWNEAQQRSSVYHKRYTSLEGLARMALARSSVALEVTYDQSKANFKAALDGWGLLSGKKRSLILDMFDRMYENGRLGDFYRDNYIFIETVFNYNAYNGEGLEKSTGATKWDKESITSEIIRRMREYITDEEYMELARKNNVSQQSLTRWM